jgi:hypothetical protein
MTAARRLQIGDPNFVGVSVVKSPYLNLICLLTDTRRPNALGERSRACIRGPGRQAMGSIIGRRPQMVPDLVMAPIRPRRDTSVAQQLARLRDLPDSVLHDDLADTFGVKLPPWWDGPAGEPRRWMGNFAMAAADAWPTVSAAWDQVQPAIDREINRVGVALARESVESLLNSLHPRVRFRDGHLSVGGPGASTCRLGSRRLVLIPMICGPDSTLLSFEGPDVAYIGYPLPGPAGPNPPGPSGDPAAPRTAISDHDGLALVLGAQRAGLLRNADRLVSMGQLSIRLECLPRSVTYHCDWLENAGLISRQRQGQVVVVQRTARAEALIDTLSK